LQVANGYAKSLAMPTDRTSQQATSPDAAPKKKPLTPAAERALAEAAARRTERDRQRSDHPKEIAGRDGPEPTRYGDWEVNGIASDF
jgi:hypothetical protein